MRSSSSGSSAVAPVERVDVGSGVAGWVGDRKLRLGAHRTVDGRGGGDCLDQSAGGTVAGLVVHRHDQVILGTGEGHVQQPSFLGSGSLLFVGSHVGEPGTGQSSEADQRPAVLPVEPRRRVGAVGAAETGDDRDREFETLGGVDGHDAQRVFALVGAELDPIDIVDASVDPRQVLRQSSTGGIAPGPGLVDHVAHPPPRFAGHLLAFAQRRGDSPPAVVELGEQLGRGALVLSPTELLEHPQGIADDARILGVDPELLVEPARLAGACTEMELHQLSVVDPEDRRAQRGDDLELVGRIIDRAQHPKQFVDLARSVDQGATLDPIRQAGLTQGVFEHAEPGSAADQHRDVAVVGRPHRPIGIVVSDQPRLVTIDHALHQSGDVGSLGPRRVFGRLVVEFRPIRACPARRLLGRRLRGWLIVAARAA